MRYLQLQRLLIMQPIGNNYVWILQQKKKKKKKEKSLQGKKKTSAREAREKISRISGG